MNLNTSLLPQKSAETKINWLSSGLAPGRIFGRLPPMPLIAIVIGILLDFIGVAGWVLTEMRSWTALIPSILGTLILVLGVLALARPGWRKHMMHLALVLALLGLVGSGKMLMRGGEPSEGHGVKVAANGSTAALCVVFLAFGIRAFVQARRARAAGGA